MSGPRRVVIAHDANGASVIAEDAVLDPLTLVPRGNQLAVLWGENSPAHLPGPMHAPTVSPFLPPSTGWRAAILTFMPDDSPLLPEGTGVGLPDLGALMARGGGRGMHTTPTIDVSLVVSGQIVVEVDGDQEVALSAGDSVVQLGGRHAWRNRTSEPAVLAVFMVGADHDAV